MKTRVQGSEAIFVPAPPSPSNQSEAPARTLARRLQPWRLRETAPLLPSASTRRLHVAGKAATALEMQDVNPYRTTWSAIVHSFRNEGAGVFWRGLAPTLIR